MFIYLSNGSRTKSVLDLQLCSWHTCLPAQKTKHVFFFLFFHRVNLLLSVFQECCRLTVSPAPLCLSAARYQTRPPPPNSRTRWSSSCTGPRDPETPSSLWQERATWLPARTAAAGPWGTDQTHHAAVNCAASTSAPFVTLLFLPAAGQPCWTVNLKPQETPITPCWRELQHSHSQTKVGSPS